LRIDGEALVETTEKEFLRYCRQIYGRGFDD